jgi:hypothetical protein
MNTQIYTQRLKLLVKYKKILFTFVLIISTFKNVFNTIGNHKKVSIIDWQSKGHGFDSHILHLIIKELQRLNFVALFLYSTKISSNAIAPKKICVVGKIAKFIKFKTQIVRLLWTDKSICIKPKTYCVTIF